MIYRVLVPAGIGLSLLLTACASGGSWRSSGNIGSLKDRAIVVEEEKIKGGLDKAIASYERFLETTPETEMTPEALRRLADLKVESVDSIYDQDTKPIRDNKPASAKLTSPIDSKKSAPPLRKQKKARQETLESIEKRSAQSAVPEKGPNKLTSLPGANTMEQRILQDDANSREAIKIYKKLLSKYPKYERNDEVLYQMARAYSVRGEQEASLKTLNRLVKKYPYTGIMDEVQFRRAEIFFVRGDYRSAARAYKAVIKVGRGSNFYDQSLYKHGWSLFKQSRYDEALKSFIGLIDYKAVGGRAAIEAFDTIERQRLDDTLRVVSFSFSYLGGPTAIAEYFRRHGKRPYEDMIYGDLGEHYLGKRRYADAAATFSKFVEKNPLHEQAPVFQMRVISVYEKGGFPKLVIEGKEEFARIYDLNSVYWKSHDINNAPQVLTFIKQNLVDLASHYHALSQKNNAGGEHKKAIKWYRTFLASFPDDAKAPGLNFLLAEILFDNQEFAAAAAEYEKTAYRYPKHEKSAEAGYAAILAYREQAGQAVEPKRPDIIRRSIASSMKFADTFPSHPQVTAVLNQAAVDMFKRGDFARAREVAQRVLTEHPKSDGKIKRSAWIIVAHSSFDLNEFPVAEKAYAEAIKLSARSAADRNALVDRLAAAVYKQGEQRQKAGELKGAVDHFLRVGKLAPESKIRATAEYDAAAALMRLKSWQQASGVLEQFRQRYPGHASQADVTQKLAVAYEQSGEPVLAAAEFERIENTTSDPALRREANIRAAELYRKADKQGNAIAAFARYVKRYPQPVGEAIEARQHLADLYRQAGNQQKLHVALRNIVKADKTAGPARTDRTRYLAAMATVELSAPIIERYRKIRLTIPLKKSLAKKKKAMTKALKVYSDMVDYGVAEVTAAATYYIADIYYDFTRAILESDRPKKLSALELEQYELLLEEQAYPFEEKAINIHKKNLQLMEQGIYNDWVGKSIEQLGKLMPARYAKVERSEAYVASFR